MGLISWADMAHCRLFVLKVPTNSTDAFQWELSTSIPQGFFFGRSVRTGSVPNWRNPWKEWAG